MKSKTFQEIRKSEIIKKRLAKYMALHCFRNTELENLHAGKAPLTVTGDFSDVKVVSGRDEIPWNEVSRFNDEEMKKLMIGVVNECYLFLWNLFNTSHGDELVEAFKEHDFLPEWNEPVFRSEIEDIEQ